MDEAKIKLALAKTLRRRDIDNLWSHLLEQHYVSEVLTGYMTIDDLVAVAKKILAAGQPTRPKAETASLAGPQPGEARSWALSMLVAAEAEGQESVTRFRSETLNGTVIARDRVAEWIEHHPDPKIPGFVGRR